MVEESSPLLPPAEGSLEADNATGRDAEPKSGEARPEPSRDPGFVCDCGDFARSACAGESFYGEREGKRYCVLHFPDHSKHCDFNEALNRKLDASDYNFRRVWFPYDLDLSGFRFGSEPDFSQAIFNATADFSRANFAGGADFMHAVFRESALFFEASFHAKAYLSHAIFTGWTDFSLVRFDAETHFSGTSFNEKADFSQAHFAAKARFSDASFNAKADFSSVEFGADIDFNFSRFGSDVDFSKAIFSAVDFGAAVFSGPANFRTSRFSGPVFFRSTIFHQEADFGDAIFDARVTFSSASFDAQVSFISTSFGAKASFVTTEFSTGANFVSASFSGNTDFGSATFNGSAYFVFAFFNEDVNLRRATFLGDANFSQATFRSSLKFSGNEERQVFSNNSSLAFDYAKFERPSGISFHTTTMRPHWFVNVDARSFDLTNVEWSGSLKREIAALEANKVSSPNRLLAIACRQLAENAETNNRYEEASRFRYWAMDLTRRTKWKGWTFWKTDWLHILYWAVSGYGERILRALSALAAVWIVFVLLYTRVGFAQQPQKAASEGPSAAAATSMTIEDRIGQPLELSRSLTYSLAVMSLQKPEPKPVTGTAQTLVLLETILGPVQAALLALAIRRKFMR